MGTAFVEKGELDSAAGAEEVFLPDPAEISVVRVTWWPPPGHRGSSVFEQRLEDRAEVILPLEDAQVEELGVAAMRARHGGEAMLMHVEEL